VKFTRFLLASALALVLIASVAMAYVSCKGGVMEYSPDKSAYWCGYDRADLIQKDPSTWDWTKGGASGKVYAYPITGYPPQPDTGEKFYVWGYNLKPKTRYTLIYYGDSTHNDVWPYATCIASGTSTNSGYLYAYGKFRYTFNDAIPHKFWVVLSSDVDCANKMMTAWNPSSYLFEKWTV
jgi:hypothetical protein